MPYEFTGRMFNKAAGDKVFFSWKRQYLDLIIEQKLCKNRYEYIRIKIYKNRAKAEIINYIFCEKQR